MQPLYVIEPRFKNDLELARTVSKCYQSPNRKLISKYLLDVIHDQNMKRNLSLIDKQSEIFGLLFLGDGATISRVTLLNNLVSGKNLPVAILELVDLQGHLADGGTKYATFICNRFIDHFKIIYPHKSIIDVIMFDGASNISLLVNSCKFAIQRLQSCVGLNTLFPFFQ